MPDCWLAWLPGCLAACLPGCPAGWLAKGCALSAIRQLSSPTCWGARAGKRTWLQAISRTCARPLAR
eukprot:4662929-Alexandrium_andersonii.AAC.1